jgi:hypothetical protein
VISDEISKEEYLNSVDAASFMHGLSMLVTISAIPVNILSATGIANLRKMWLKSMMNSMVKLS